MPIKKKLPIPKPAAEKKPTTTHAAPAKRVARRIDAPPPTTQAQPLELDEKMGQPLDPATLPGANESAPSLAGTSYSMTYSTSSGSSVWVFNEKRATTNTLWCWRQCGAAVVFEYKTARYIGRFEGDIIKGTASNTSGANWSWEGKLVSNAHGMECYHSPL